MKLLTCLASVLAATVLAGPTPALAQSWPDKPVRVLLPFPPGGVLDSLVRPLASRLQQSLRQPVYIENVSGAGGNIGMAQCARARPDGYTLCITTNHTISYNPFLYTQMQYDPQRDLAPVQRLAWVDGVFVSTSKSGIRSFKELAAAARARPGQVTWGSFGAGSTAHLYQSALQASMNVPLLHVPYRGSAPLLQALLAGEVDTGFLATGIVMQHIQAGRIVPLVATAPARLPSLPDVPSLKEVGIEIYIPAWFGAFAPAGTPADILERLNQEMAAIVTDKTFIDTVLTPAGFRPAVAGLPQLTAFLTEDRANGEKLVRMSGTTLD